MLMKPVLGCTDPNQKSGAVSTCAECSFVMAGHGASKTRANALLSRPSTSCLPNRKTWMPATGAKCWLRREECSWGTALEPKLRVHGPSFAAKVTHRSPAKSNAHCGFRSCIGATVRVSPDHRTMRVGTLLCVSTSFAWLPMRSRSRPRRPCEAMTIRSQPRSLAVAMMPSAGCWS